MGFQRWLQGWHLPFLHAVGVLVPAVIWVAHEEAGFLGTYLLMLGEFAAGVLVIRFGKRRDIVGHLMVVVIAMAGTFAVLVSLSTCAPAHLPEGATCSPLMYWYAFRALAGNIFYALLVVPVTIFAHCALFRRRENS